MAGKPKTKARLEAQRASMRAKGRFTDGEKRAILARAETVGPKLAAEEAGVSPATLRTWRARLPADVEMPVAVAASAGAGIGSPSGAVGLRAQADKERVAMSRALDQADRLLAKGLASEARNASVVAGVRADRARELEESARAEELHEAALSKATAERVLDLVRQVFADVGLVVPSALLRERLAVWPDAPPPGVVEQARDLVRRALREEFRAELPAEASASADDIEAPGASPDDDGEQAPEEEPLVPVPMQDVPLDFRNRFALGDDGQERARVAWSTKLRDEQRQREATVQAAEEAAVRVPRRVSKVPKLPKGWDRAPGRHGINQRAGF